MNDSAAWKMFRQNAWILTNAAFDPARFRSSSLASVVDFRERSQMRESASGFQQRGEILGAEVDIAEDSPQSADFQGLSSWTGTDVRSCWRAMT
jgi:hypothetical protein